MWQQMKYITKEYAQQSVSVCMWTCMCGCVQIEKTLNVKVAAVKDISCLW